MSKIKSAKKLIKSLINSREYYSVNKHDIERAPNDHVKWNNIEKFYREREGKILKNGKRWMVSPSQFYWFEIFTPIERMFFEDIRRVGNIVLFPQYPVSGCFIDFANPALRIGVETDGKEWHDREKDYQRDKDLEQLGWTIYRLTGKECNRDISLAEIEEDYSLSQCEKGRKLKEYFYTTSEGLARALRIVYFTNESYYKEYAKSSLEVHTKTEIIERTNK